MCMFGQRPSTSVMNPPSGPFKDRKRGLQFSVNDGKDTAGSSGPFKDRKSRLSLSTSDNTTDNPDYQESIHSESSSEKSSAADIEEVNPMDDLSTDVDAGPSTSTRKKWGGYNCVQRECPICHKSIRRPAQHFKQTHPSAEYEQYRQKITF